MNANDVTTFLAMGGYGLYVWGSLAMCAAVFAGELLSLRARRQALLHELSQEDAPAPLRAPVLSHREGQA